MTTAGNPSGGLRGVHLVGSVPLEDAETVFRSAADTLGRHLRRVPDGETGERADWIRWQMPVLGACPALVPVTPDPTEYVPRARLEIGPGRSPTDIRFGPLGYAAAARSSYEVFVRLRADGVLPPEWRFQVCLPTPLAPVAMFIARRAQPAVEPAYEAAMRREVDEILGVIPHADLAIQWDTAVEFGMLEGVFPTWFDDPEQGIVERLLRVGERIPPDVPCGYHLCYGDAGHKHFTEPKDAGRLATVARALISGLGRPPAWIHLPVPAARDDDGYYEPLRELDLPGETELYLGLVHHSDGLAGIERRARAARRVLPYPFGIATECGLGRRPPQSIADLLQIHAQAADPVRSG